MIFGSKVGLHVHKNPAGTFSYVGGIPTDLMKEVPATKGDVLGCRAFRDKNGELKAHRNHCFETRESAVKYAEEKGFTVEPDIN